MDYSESEEGEASVGLAEGGDAPDAVEGGSGGRGKL